MAEGPIDKFSPELKKLFAIGLVVKRLTILLNTLMNSGVLRSDPEAVLHDTWVADYLDQLERFSDVGGRISRLELLNYVIDYALVFRLSCELQNRPWNYADPDMTDPNSGLILLKRLDGMSELEAIKHAGPRVLELYRAER